MRDCAKHFLIVLPIAPISSRPEPTPIASDARLSGKGKNSTDEPVQMTETGKPGKQESCFPPFPLSLGIPQSGIPTFTQLRPFPSRSQPNAEPPGPTFAGKVGPDLVDIRRCVCPRRLAEAVFIAKRPLLLSPMTDLQASPLAQNEPE